MMRVSKVMVAITPAHKGLPSSPNDLSFEICHFAGEVSPFSCMGLCSLVLLPELTHCLLCVYDDLQGELSLRLSQSASTEST